MQKKSLRTPGSWQRPWIFQAATGQAPYWQQSSDDEFHLSLSLASVDTSQESKYCTYLQTENNNKNNNIKTRLNVNKAPI